MTRIIASVEDDLAARNRRSFRLTIALFVVVFLGLAGWKLGAAFLFQSKMGGECKNGSDCSEDGAMCLRKEKRGKGFCTRRCQSESDCSGGLHCKATFKLDHSFWDGDVELAGGKYCMHGEVIE